MRTCALFIAALLVTTATAIGQQASPLVLPGTGPRTMGPSPLRKPMQQDAELTIWLDRRPGQASTALRRLVASRKPEPLARTTTLQQIHATPGGSELANEMLTPLAPFDTVYEQGFFGPRRHVYHCDAQGRVLTRSTESRTANGWDETARIECTYTPSGRLETRTEYDSAFEGHISQRDVYAYDAAGRQISAMIAWYDPSTGSMLGTRRDSTAFDVTGEGILRQSEYSPAGGPVTGWRTAQFISDSVHMYTSYDRTADGWIPVDRRSYMSVPNTATMVLEESWTGSRWVNEWYSTYIGLSIPGEVISASWVWKEKAWIPESRDLWFTGERWYTDEFRREHWIGDTWVPVTRQFDRYDDAGQCVYWRLEEWEHGWVIRYSGSYGDTPDPGRRHVDSTWSDGSLTGVEALTLGQDFEILALRHESWEHGAMTGGCTLDRRLTPTGQTAEFSSGTWTAGAWEDVYRYTFVYGPDARLLSLRHAIHTGDGWVPSFSASRWDTAHGAGTSWEFDDNDDPSWTRRFSGFSELLFVYRTGLNDVPAEHASVPERTELHQNYPNPFNPTTTIPFAVGTGARTTIAIFDILGREVARPVDEWKDPGEYHVQFDASGLASGMYICRFSSGNVSQTRKLMLVR